jgi:hypothetical protein
MKTLLNKLPKGRLTRWGFLAVLLIAVGATVGWMNQRQYQLGGAFIGNNGDGGIWTGFQVPLDPAGRTAAIRVKTMTYSADTAGLLEAFGVDTLSEFMLETKMISRTTAKYSSVGYGLKQGNPPQVCLILVMRGTMEFSGPDDFVVNYIIDVYPGPANLLGLPSADANLDGYPDEGAVPAYSIPGEEHASRVPNP